MHIAGQEYVFLLTDSSHGLGVRRVPHLAIDGISFSKADERRISQGHPEYTHVQTSSQEANVLDGEVCAYVCTISTYICMYVCLCMYKQAPMMAKCLWWVKFVRMFGYAF
jgi:hypothetical protein